MLNPASPSSTTCTAGGVSEVTVPEMVKLKGASSASLVAKLTSPL